jgi:phenylacetate-CoA ligase
MLEMDSSFLTVDRMGDYVEQIRKFRPDYLIGFPSSIYLLAKFVRDESVALPKVKGIMLASENVYPWQRKMLEAIFDCRIFSHYGHSEMALLAMEAETTHDLLVFPEY